MTRKLLLTLAAAAAGFAGAALVADDAAALAPAQLVGVYRIKLKGDGWIRPKGGAYAAEHLLGNAALIVARDAADDARIKVEIRLDPALEGGLLDLATSEPAFVGSAYVAGDSIAFIDTGTPGFVNALTLDFLKDGGKVQGHWMAVFPASSAANVAASGFGVEFVGKRTVPRGSAAVR